MHFLITNESLTLNVKKFKLYHEATLVNLLETILFYEEVAEATGDISLDLVDYCHRKLLNIAARFDHVSISYILCFIFSRISYHILLFVAVPLMKTLQSRQMLVKLRKLPIVRYAL